ncbi:YfdX family protein [Sulfurimonas sp.]
MKTKLLLSTVLASLLMSSTALFASSYQDSVASKEAKALNHPASVHNQMSARAKVEEAQDREAFLAKVDKGEFKKEVTQDEERRLQTIISKAVQTHKHSMKKAPKEFMNGLKKTVQALQAIHANKIKTAETLLEGATKEFDTAFKTNPKLDFIPVADNIDIISFNGNAKLIKHIKDSAIKLLKDNDTQAAIDILTPLQDEMTMRTQLVPAFLYPKATKEAAKDLKAGKKDAAFKVLMTALSATQVDTVILPIPLLTAQDMILQASKLEKSHKKEATKLLNSAQDELQRAMLLGYTHKFSKNYKEIEKQIEALKTEIKGKNVVVKLYDKLLNSFKDLTKKHTEAVKTNKK